jgi:ADP-heptose:LPS heptosyltransferase
MTKKKILVIRYEPLKYFINCIPAFAAIRKKHENDEITILTEKSLISFCKKSRLFDKVWLDSKPDWFQFRGVKDIIRRLRAGNFDMVYDLQNDNRSVWYFKLIGFKKPRWNSSSVDWCSDYYRPSDEPAHFQDIIHNQLRMSGIKATPLIDISYMAVDEGQLLPERFAMICAAGDRDKKAHKWHPARYAEVIDYLHNVHDITSVLIGDDKDDALINAVIANQCLKAKPINYSGKTTIGGIVAVAKKAEFCLGNETAATHIAAYSGCKTIMICSRFSPPELLGPRVKNIAYIEEPMLEDVEVDRAIRAIEEFGLVPEESNEFKTFKTISENKLAHPEVLLKAQEA